MSEAISAGPVAGAPPIQNPQRALLWLGLIPFIGLALIAIGVMAGLRGDELVMHCIAIGTGVLCFIPPAIDRVRPPEKRHVFLSILAPIFAVYFVMGVYTEYFFFPESAHAGRLRLISIEPADIVVGQLAALLGLVSLMVGFLLPIGGLAAQLFPLPRTDWPLSSTLRVALVMTAIGWAIFLSGQFGVLPGFLGSGFLGSFASSFYFGASILMIAWLRYRSKSALFVMAVLVPPTMLFSALTGSKKLLLSPLAVVAVTHIMYTRKLRLSWLAGGGALLVMIYPLANFYREAIQVGNRLGAIAVLRHPERLINGISLFLENQNLYDYVFAGFVASSVRLSALGILTVIVRDTPQYVPFQEGWTIWQCFIAFIPRVIWPGKPVIGIGQWITDNYTAPGHLIASQTGSSWMGELYLNFSWPGIAIGMFIFGVYFRFLQDTFMRTTTAIPVLLAGVAILWTVLPALQSTLQVPINGIIFAMFPIIFAHLLVRLFFGATAYSRASSSSVPSEGLARSGI